MTTNEKPLEKPTEDKPITTKPKKEEWEENFYTLKQAAPKIMMSVASIRQHIKLGDIKAGRKPNPQHPDMGQQIISESEIKRIRKLMISGQGLPTHRAAEVPFDQNFKPIDKTAPQKPEPKPEEKPKEEEEGWYFHPLRSIR